MRTSGETDYTYVKLEFDGYALQLPDCPSEEKLAELGLIPKKGDAAASGASSPSAKSQGGGGGLSQQQQEQREREREAENLPEIKTLGDSRLAAAIAALTAGDDKPSDAAAEGGPARRLLGASGGHTPLGREVFKDGKDPFEGLVTKPETGAQRGAVHVISQPAGGPAVSSGAAPSIAITFFFGMSANKTVSRLCLCLVVCALCVSIDCDEGGASKRTPRQGSRQHPLCVRRSFSNPAAYTQPPQFAYGKGNSVTVPADGVKFNIEASNW